LRLFTLVVVMAIGCSRAEPRATPTADVSTPERTMDPRLLVLQPLKANISDMLRRARAEETCFVLFGEMDTAGRISRADLPPEYLQALRELRQNTVAGSAGEFRDTEYCDRTTGKAGILISIDFDWAKGKHEVVVSLGFRRNGLDGFGESVRVLQDGNEWVARERLRSWVS